MRHRSSLRQAWLVARRELRERVRSKGLWAGTVAMLLIVVAAIVVPQLAESRNVTKHVGFAGAVPEALPGEVVDQGQAQDVTVRVHRFGDQTAGEEAVRDEDVDVLVADGRRLLWRGGADDRLRAIVTGAIQMVAVRQRASAAGITADQLAAIAAPVEVENEELGISAGRSPDDETAAYVMSVLLLIALASYGQLVLTGVVQEKSSRVVEVLLARMPARSLLAGKVAGIGLIGLGQFVLTALAALLATAAVKSVDIPAISGDVLAWVVVWFVLGYAIYAMLFGAFGSLASRTEDASSIAAPATTLLLVGYWASLLAVTADPEGAWARLVSYFPVTAPFAMPGRVALGVAPWWEPVAAAALTLVAIAGLVVFAGRVYAGAILRTGATVKVWDAWRGTSGPADVCTTPTTHGIPRTTNGALAGVALAGAVYVFTRDVIMGLAVGAGFYAVGSRIAKVRHHDAVR